MFIFMYLYLALLNLLLLTYNSRTLSFIQRVWLRFNIQIPDQQREYSESSLLNGSVSICRTFNSSWSLCVSFHFLYLVFFNLLLL